MNDILSNDVVDETESCPKKMKREICKYGINCYRKNFIHFGIYEHPKDHSFYTTIKDVNAHGNLCEPCESLIPDKVNKINGIYLTKIMNKSCNFNELSLSDVLSNFNGKLLKSAQFNFMFDCKWLMLQYPLEYRNSPMLLVHGDMFNEKEISQANIEGCKADLPIQYGTHHTKMMLLQYDTGMRVVIHTANLIPDDWDKKTQCIWMSDVFPLMDTTNKFCNGDSKTEFRKDLIDYLNSYRKKPIYEWISLIQKHNFSSCKVHFISSSPGRHQGSNINKFGHMKLRHVLQKEFQDRVQFLDSDLVAQFSSIGSLGPSKDSWLLGEFKTSLMGCYKNSNVNSLSTNDPNLQLIYPCVDDVRNSLEGYLSGSSLPYTSSVHSKQLWIQSFFSKWRAKISNRDNASPHMKSYLRMSKKDNIIHWYMISSANLSKAAWGSLEKKNSQLAIRSYEVGVLFLPSHYDVSHFSTVEKTDPLSMYIPIPYDLPPFKYSDNDDPWLVDRDYKMPDVCGNAWCH